MNTRSLSLSLFCALFVTLCAVLPPVFSHAATTTTLAGKSATQFTRIESSSFEFDREKGVAIYKGNVQVRDSEMDLLCEEMLVRFGSSTNRFIATNAPPTTNAPARPMLGIGGRIESIIALRSVVIVNKKDKSRATGQKAVYNAATDIIELTGGPAVLETEQGTVQGEIIEMDRRNNKLSVKRARMDIIQNPTKTTNDAPPGKAKAPGTNDVKTPLPPAPPKVLPKKKRDTQA